MHLKACIRPTLNCHNDNHCTVSLSLTRRVSLSITIVKERDAVESINNRKKSNKFSGHRKQ